MSNFTTTYLAGQAGLNKGITTGLPGLDKAIHGLQKKTIIGLAAAPKCGKTTLADFAFVLSPYLYMLQQGRINDIEWIYYSYEVDRVSKEFKFAAFFFYVDYQLFSFSYKGEEYEISKDYLMGKLEHKNPDGTIELIKLSEEHDRILKEIYINRIVPLFGEYNDKGVKVRSGKITIIEEQDNPTGMYKYLLAHAERNGELLKEKYNTKDDSGNIVVKERIVGYVEKNIKKMTIIVTDHARKLKRERGFTMKENIDKWFEYQVILRNLCLFSFVNVLHNHRGLANVERLKQAGEFIYPTGDDSKDSGNPAEECNLFLTMFNPNDEKYNLEKHFGVEVRNYPKYRSIHLTDSRDTECPVHIQTNMYGNVNYFTPLFP